MKVLLINHFPLQGSGSGIYTMNIARELQKKGHETFVIDIDNVPDTAEYPFRRKTIFCDRSKNSEADLSFNFPCFTTHPRSTVTFYDLSDDQINEYINVYSGTVNKIIADFKPDIIHAQHLWVTPYVAMKTNIPYVITVHGTDLMGFRKDKRYHKFAKEAAANAKGIITISKQVHENTKELFNLNDDKLKLIPNGFDSDIFKVRDINKTAVKNKFGLSGYDHIISFVGKFTDFKGIDILIKAAKIVTSEIPDIAFALAGDGELRTEMEALAKTLGLTNIRFLGHQDQISVSELYNIADLSVVPSRIEPFGLVAIEALACGTPVVASNAGGLPDFINSEVGRLFQMNNFSELAEVIIKEITENAKSNKGPYASAYALKNYSWRKSIEILLNIFLD